MTVAIRRSLTFFRRIEIGAMIVFSLLAVGSMVMAFINAKDTEQAARTTAMERAEQLDDLFYQDWQSRITQILDLGRIAALMTREYHDKNPQFVRAKAVLEAEIRAAGPAISQVSDIGPDGFLRWSSLPMPNKPIDLRQREHFRAVAVYGHDLFVGHPVVGKVSGVVTLQFAIAVRAPDNTLQGVTIVSVNAARTERLETQLAKLGGGIVSVVRGDGVLLSRNRPERAASAAIAASPFFQRVKSEGYAAQLHASPVDDRQRFVAGRYSPTFDLVFIVGVGADTALHNAYQSADRLMIGAVFLSFVLIALGLTMVLLARRERRSLLTRYRAAELERSAALLRQIADQATDMITLHDADFRFLYVSSASLLHLGREPEPLIGQAFDAYVIEEDRQRVRRELLRPAQSGRSWRLACRAKHVSGELRWLEAEVVVVTPDSQIKADEARYMAIWRDVTERKLAEQALNEARLEFAALADLGPGRLYRILLGSKDKPRVHIHASDRDDADTSLAAYRDPKFFWRHVVPEDVSIKKQALRQCRRDGQSVAEYRLLRGTAGVVWVRDEMRLATEPDGGRSMIVGYISEITHERAAKERLKQVERLATLGEVAAGIAHEMNQPLAIIASAAENAIRIYERDRVGGGEERILSKLERIQRQAIRLSSVINHIRFFGHAQSDLNMVTTWNAVIENVLLLTESRLEQSGVRLQTDAPESMPNMEIAAIPLEQVLVNLIVNACDAYDSHRDVDGALRIDRIIQLRTRFAGERLLISVADEAGGIPPAMLDRIFDPFFTTKGPDKGSGLGLSICLATVTDHGGTITVHNSDGGAVFEIELPAPIADPVRSTETI